jgi:hypothetical protein
MNHESCENIFEVIHELCLFVHLVTGEGVGNSRDKLHMSSQRPGQDIRCEFFLGVLEFERFCKE